jgi:hypothetical protein
VLALELIPGFRAWLGKNAGNLLTQGKIAEAAEIADMRF